MYYKELFSLTLFLFLPITKGAIPGTFFWRPRFGLDLAIPTTEPTLTAYQPNKQNIQAGLVVLIDGYDILTSLLGLVSGIQYAHDDETMNPNEGLYYTNVYRWALRTIELFPHWIRGNFHDALGVWKKRFTYMDAQVPDWLRKLLPWVTKESWDKENVELQKFRKDSEVAFSPFYRFPSKTFHGFNSFLPASADEFVFSSEDRDDFSHKPDSLERQEIEKKLSEALHGTTTTTVATTTTNTTTTNTTQKNAG